MVSIDTILFLNLLTPQFLNMSMLMQDSSLGTPQSSPGSTPSFGDSFSSRQSSSVAGRGALRRDRDRDSESESDFSAKVSGFEDDDYESTIGSEATSMAESSIVAGSAASARQNLSLIHGKYEAAETSMQKDSSTDEDSEEDEYGDGDTLSGIQSDSQSTRESTESTTQSSSSRSTISGVTKQQPAGAFLTQITRDFSHRQRTYTTRPGPGVNLRGAAMGGVHVSRLSRTTLDSESSGVLHAVSSGDMSLLKEELKGGEASQRVMDSNRRTPLHVACSFGRLEMVKMFIEMGMNVDACSMTGQTPLHEACIGGHYSVLKLLLSRVSDLDVIDSNGLSAAHYCALNGEAKCLEVLCEQVS